MLLGVRNDCIFGTDLVDKGKAIKDLGYDFLELALRVEEIRSLNLSQIETFKAAAKEAGLPIKQTSLGHFPMFAAKEVEERKAILEDIRTMIDLTHALGGDVMLVATKEESEDIQDYVSTYVSELKSVADYAQTKGVVLALEPVGRVKPSVIDGLIRAIEHPAVGMYYDMGNCLFGGEDPVEEAKRSADITRAVHIKGAMETALSEMPLQEILEVFIKADFQGAGCLEIGPRDESNKHLEDAIKLLRSLGY